MTAIRNNDWTDTDRFRSLHVFAATRKQVEIVQGRGANVFAPHSPPSQSTGAWRFGRLFAAVAALLARWQRRESTRRQLARLDARLLADIGLDPDAVRVEIGRLFWQEYTIARFAEGERPRSARVGALGRATHA